MYLVPTEVRPSEIHGLGVFTLQPIGLGSVVWQVDDRIDIVINIPEGLEGLPDHIVEHLRVRSTTLVHLAAYRISLDNNQFTNHSYQPNLEWDRLHDLFLATRNIDAGEELTKDYRQYSHSRYARSL